MTKSKAQARHNQEKRAKKAVLILNRAYEKNQHFQNVVDMLTDIRHLCHVKKIPFYGCVGRSYQHYLAEKKGEPS